MVSDPHRDGVAAPGGDMMGFTCTEMASVHADGGQ